MSPTALQNVYCFSLAAVAGLSRINKYCTLEMEEETVNEYVKTIGANRPSWVQGDLWLPRFRENILIQGKAAGELLR